MNRTLSAGEAKEMKVGIISDTHGDTLCWEKALKIFTGCELVLHAGDILNHGPLNPILPTYNPLALAEKMLLSRSRVHPAK